MDPSLTSSSLAHTPSLGSLLPAGFITPEGTELTFASFRARGSYEWTVNAVESGGQPICYRIKATETSKSSQQLATCSAEPGHVPEGEFDACDWGYPVTDYFTRLIGTSVEAPLENWVATIMLADAQGTRENRCMRWDSAELDKEMERLELGIVSYFETEVAASSFRSPHELESWLRRVLGRTELDCDVMSLSDRSHSKRQPSHSSIRGSYIVDGRVRQSYGRAVKDNESAMAILSRTASAFEQASTGAHGLLMGEFKMRWSGRAVIGYRAFPALSWDPTGERGPIATGDDESPEWFGIRFARTQVVIPVHRTKNNICIEIDDDGFLVSMRIILSRDREKYFRRRYAFESKWGKWLDGQEKIPESEIRTAISQLEAQLDQRIVRERNDGA